MVDSLDFQVYKFIKKVVNQSFNRIKLRILLIEKSLCPWCQIVFLNKLIMETQSTGPYKILIDITKWLCKFIETSLCMNVLFARENLFRKLFKNISKYVKNNGLKIMKIMILWTWLKNKSLSKSSSKKERIVIKHKNGQK